MSLDDELIAPHFLRGTILQFHTVNRFYVQLPGGLEVEAVMEEELIEKVKVLPEAVRGADRRDRRDARTAGDAAHHRLSRHRPLAPLDTGW